MSDAATISGVVTTGIYCRAGCPGRPKQRNVVGFASPVAAEAAGFRACYRCRPDRLPPAAMDSVPQIVADALRILNEGALDDGNEEDLGKRVGLSGRQLRRLFLEQIGATPTLVARSRRAHFARRLLDETDLSIARVGFAAGFSSVRQMNRVMLETFRGSPSDLRDRRRDADRLVADGGLRLRVPLTGPYDFGSMLAFLRARATPGVECVDSVSYRRTITTCGNPGVVDVRDGGDGQHLLLTAHLPTFDSLIDDVARIRRLFGLDHSSVLQMEPLLSDPHLAPFIRKNPGIRVPGAWDRFEVAVRIIIGQGISVRAASTLAGRLVATFGTRVPGLDALGLTHTFPPARRLANASVAQLSSVGLPRNRAMAIRAFARSYSCGDISLDSPSSLEPLVQHLVALPGIGAWTANFIALRAAGQLDAFPAADLGLQRAFAMLDPAPCHVNDLLGRAEAWRPYRGVAAVCLWQSLASER